MPDHHQIWHYPTQQKFQKRGKIEHQGITAKPIATQKLKNQTLQHSRPDSSKLDLGHKEASKRG